MVCYNPIKLVVGNTFVKKGKVMVCEPRYVTVSCGRCLACQGQKSNELAMRCEHENIYYGYGRNSCFVTLTYDNKHLPSDYSLHKDDLQKFIKRLRINLQRKVDKSLRIRYFAVGEYGSQKGRPHYHLIVYGLGNNKVTENIVNLSWKQGFIYVGSCTGESIKYVCKYMNKARSMYLNSKDYLLKTGRERPFRLFSKGFGKRWLLDNYKNIIDNDFKISYNGGFYSIPRVYIRWIWKLNLDSDISSKLDYNRKLKFFNVLKDLCYKYDVDVTKYSNLPDDFKYSLEYYEDFYNLWHKEQEDKKLSYEVKHSEYLVNLAYSKKLKPLEIA